MKNKDILIIGCGWIGKKLGKELADEGYSVTGTTRSIENFPEIEKQGIQPFLLELTPQKDTSDIELPAADAVIISITPGRGEGRSKYPSNMDRLARYLSESNAQVIMYSSTSAYNNLKNEVNEEDARPDSSSSNMILAGEGALRVHCPQANILRLCGLYGEDRHPAKYLAGRKGIENGEAPVNLVHRDDVISATKLLIGKDVKGEIFNVCAESHPQKQQIYPEIARQLGYEVPEYEPGGKEEKQVSARKIKELGLRLSHPDPMDYSGNP